MSRGFNLGSDVNSEDVSDRYSDEEEVMSTQKSGEKGEKKN